MVRNLPIVGPEFKLLPMHYCNSARCREFAMSLSAAIKGCLWEDILASPFVTVLIDESTDISTSENFVVYFIYLKNGRSVASYVTLVHVAAVDAESIADSLFTFFEENGLDSNKIVGFCSDGASVMTGCQNGVGVRLQRVTSFLMCVHCIAHRLALCCTDAAGDVDYPDMAENTVNNISAFLNRSGKRTHQLKELAAELGLSRTRIAKSGKTRWLSRSQCMIVLIQLFYALQYYGGS